MTGHRVHPVDDAVRTARWFAAPHLGGGDVVLAAVSGGVDSMALFDALLTVARERGFTVIAAHLDHRLRPGSERDFELVAAHAAARGARAILGSADVAARARERHESLEAAARAERYAFLERTADAAGARWIVTAHTASDQAETVLMRIRRGAGTRGVAGILPERERIVRPLLGVSRRDTEDYCAARRISFVRDPSNDDVRFTRNHIRRVALPELRRVFPGIDESLVRMSAHAQDELARVRTETRPRLLACLERESALAWRLDASALASLDDDETMMVFADTLSTIGAGRDVTRAHYQRLAHLATGASAHLPGVRVRREHDGYVFETGERATAVASAPAQVAVPGMTRAGTWMLRAETGSGATAYKELRRPRGALTQWVASQPGDTFYARALRPGDTIQPFGMRGTRKLSDILIDSKVPRRHRGRLLVIERDGEIVWVPGVIASESARVNDNSPSAIRLRADIL